MDVNFIICDERERETEETEIDERGEKRYVRHRKEQLELGGTATKIMGEPVPKGEGEVPARNRPSAPGRPVDFLPEATLERNIRTLPIT